jgi:hypothetical protein
MADQTLVRLNFGILRVHSHHGWRVGEFSKLREKLLEELDVQ